MATVTKPIALDESFNTTEVTPRNIADVLAEELSRITGRNASQVEYDNTESGLDADNVQDALDEINGKIPTVPSVDIQTAVDEFSTYNGGILSSLKVALSPIQDLHGYDNPWVGGAGKNKFVSAVAKTETQSGITVSTSGDGIYHISGTSSANVNISFPLKQGFTIPTSDAHTFYLKNTFDNGSVTLLLYNGATGVDSWTCTPLDRSYSTYQAMGGQYIDNVIVQVLSGVTVNGSIAPMIIPKTESDTSYEPWDNICPISGHTQVEVDVSDGQTTQEQVTVNLGGTYYSGTLDVVSGELTVDSAFIASYNGETLPSTWISDRDVYAVGTTPTTGAEVCYKLATPTPIQLSPTMVKALVGENHLDAPLDGQEITESKYKQMFTFDDVIAYIQSLS